MKKYIKKLVRWAFKTHVKVYYKRVMLYDTEKMMNVDENYIVNKIHKDIIFGMAEQLLKDGIIKIEREERLENSDTIFTGKIYCLK